MPAKRPNQTSITIPLPVRKRLDAAAEQRGISRGALILIAIDEFLVRQWQTRREQEAEAATPGCVQCGRPWGETCRCEGFGPTGPLCGDCF